MTLEQLSAAATEGTLINHGWGDGSTQMGMTNIFNEDAEVLVMECIPEADAAFIVALWNTYRTGQLVAVADGAIERVAELERALEPFARHVGKVDAPVTLKIGNDTWTGTLTGADFANASHVLNLRIPSYRDCLAAKGTGDAR